MMEGSPGGSNSPPPFLTKTYEMVDDPATDSIVSWSTTNSSFIVRNPPEFSKDLLPKYFKHNNFSSFIRQLNTYGFRKVDPDQWEFANEEFIRGQKHLLKNIHRRKPIHSHSLHNQHIQGSSSGGLTELEKQEFEDEVEKLKHDKNLLMLELQKHTLEKQEIKTQMQFLETRFYKMEERQREVTGFLSRVMGKPEFVSNLVQLSEKNNKKRRLFKQDYFLDETCHEENPVVLFKPITREESDGISLPTPNMVPFEKLESSLKSWENFLFKVCHASGEEMSNFGVPLQSTSLLSSEMNTSSGEPDMNILPQSPVLHLGSSCSRDIHSSPELTESTCLAESPVISSIQLSVDVQLKSSGIDVNSKPAGSLEIETSNEPVVEAKSGQPVRVNDVFWEQFLTETPGSSDTAEVQSERRDTVERKDVKSVDRGKYWWNVNRDNVDNLTEQMGQLTQAERT